MFGFIAYDAKGKGAVQKIAKRRLDVIEGNVNSHSKLLNDPKRMGAMEDLNKLVSGVAQVSEENEQRKVQRKEKKDAYAAQKARKKADSVAKEAMEKAEVLPLYTPHVLKFKARAERLNVLNLLLR